MNFPDPDEGQSLHDAIDQKQEEGINLLISLMDDPSMDRAVAKRFLQKHDGDVNRAANAFLEGDNEGIQSSTKSNMSPTLQAIRPGNNSPIDLTADDDEGRELDQAIKASLVPHYEAVNENRLVPSNRPPDPNWAVVPSNVSIDPTPGVNMSTDEQNVSLAIEASLKSSYNDFANEEFEPLPIEQQLREGNRPVALRPALATLQYAALILQCLFFVPQVRKRVAEWRPSAPPDVSEIPPPLSGPEHTLWTLVETFVNMDYARVSELNVDGPLTAFEAVPWSSGTDRVGDLSYRFYSHITRTAEDLIREHMMLELQDNPKPHLFHFIYGQSLDQNSVDSQETSIVKVEAGIRPPSLAPLLSYSQQDEHDDTDLISRLAANLSRPDDPSSEVVIFEASEVVAFQLSRSYGGDGGSKGFKYSKRIYLDQFLHTNAELIQQKRREQLEMNAEIQRLIARRKALISFENRDVLQDLKSSLYYYENVADAKEDLERKSAIEITAQKLRKIMEKMNSEIKDIDQKLSALKKNLATIMDSPELQNHPYDLRVVLIHDGLLGRRHLYSYVQDNGIWYKIMDSSVQEVSEETVLDDQIGLHLGAGPYLLIYSRAIPDEDLDNYSKLTWPEDVKNAVKLNNEDFLSTLPPEIAAKVTKVDSPPSSPVDEKMDTSI